MYIFKTFGCTTVMLAGLLWPTLAGATDGGTNVISSSTVQQYWPGTETLCASASLSLNRSAGTLAVSWPAWWSNVDNFVYLETASSLSPSATWTNLDTPRSVAGNAIVAGVPAEDGERYFRLRTPCSLPIFEFAIYYNSLLEFTWAAPATIGGPVYSAGDIYLGSAWSNVFNRTVASGGAISFPSWDGHLASEFLVPPTFNGAIPTVTNVAPAPFWNGFNPATFHEMINQPPPEGDTNITLAQGRYYNKAQIILLVSNATVTAKIQYATIDPAPVYMTASYNPTNFAATNFTAISSNFPFLSITNGAPATDLLKFYDGRELKMAFVTQVDMGKLNTWIATNIVLKIKFTAGSGLYPNIMYVADNRSWFNSATGFAAVRLMNGAVIPTNAAPGGMPTGFTVATPNPLYVWGNYNIPSSTNWYPASFVSDALTILSPRWTDANSTLALSSRLATNTTINAAIITGNVPSTGPGNTTYSGGVMNLPRLLEDWSYSTALKTLTLNTSLVCLYGSERVTAQYNNPGQYYYAPARNFLFDTNLNNITGLPPGTPSLMLP